MPLKRGVSWLVGFLPDDHIYVNRVGIFGLACASYWWSRIAGCGVRLLHELLGPTMPIELLIFADDVESLGTSAGAARCYAVLLIPLHAVVPIQVGEATWWLASGVDWTFQ